MRRRNRRSPTLTSHNFATKGFKAFADRINLIQFTHIRAGYVLEPFNREQIEIDG
jgi:hypothetical protein